MEEASVGKPVRFFVGSCPDYSNNGEIYTHEDLGDGVPLLTRVHLQSDAGLLIALEELKVPYEYVIMVADVEAIDEVFCNRFTNGNEAEFLNRCKRSEQKTKDLLNKMGLGSKLRSSSFFGEFGRGRFMELQADYEKVLAVRLESDNSFRMRVLGDLIARSEMYRKMYPDNLFSGMTGNERTDFLIKRTLRTMAQYLALGRQIGEKQDECFPMIIVHQTRNKGVFNERNKFLLPGDGLQPQPTIPVFEMKRKVY